MHSVSVAAGVARFLRLQKVKRVESDDTDSLCISGRVVGDQKYQDLAALIEGRDEPTSSGEEEQKKEERRREFCQRTT